MPEIVTPVPPVVGPVDVERELTFGAVFGVAPKNSDMLEAVAAAPG